MKRIFKYLCVITFAMLPIVVVLTLWANYAINESSKDYVTNNISELEPTKVGLLLGTRRLLPNGNENTYFFHRIDAGVSLYENGKIQYFIVSGDNSKKEYNEPEDMRNELVERGIPEHVIFLDYAGFRTLDSVVRAKEIFGQKSFIIISQKFHNERAVFLARKNGILAFGYNADDVGASQGLKTKVREYFARDKAFIDLLFGVDPKFLGKKVSIE